MRIKKDKVVVLFSGGMDSTAAAAYYLLKKYRVYLVTFDNGAERGFDRSRKRADLIKKKFDKQCKWKLLTSTSLFHEIAIKNLARDIKKYGNLICVGCKIAMLSESIIFCKEKGIKIIADGFEKGQIYYPEQTPEYMSVTGSFAREFEISYEHPIYNLNRKQINQVVGSSGIKGQPIQASCLFAFNRVRSKKIKKYTLDKLPIARRYIRKALKI